MDTIIFLTADAATSAQNILDTISAWLPFPWNCVVSGVGSAVLAVLGWRKLTKKTDKSDA